MNLIIITSSNLKLPEEIKDKHNIKLAHNYQEGLKIFKQTKDLTNYILITEFVIQKLTNVPPKSFTTNDLIKKAVEYKINKVIVGLMPHRCQNQYMEKLNIAFAKTRTTWYITKQTRNNTEIYYVELPITGETANWLALIKSLEQSLTA